MSQSRTRFALALLAAICLTPVAHAAPGDPVGEEFRVSPDTADSQELPAVAMDADGDFVVVWQNRDGFDRNIFAQRFDAAGMAQGAEFRVNTDGVANSQQEPAVAMDADGDFVVVWGGWGVFAQRFDAAGVAQGTEIVVGSYMTGDGGIDPAVAMDAGGGFVVTWEKHDGFNSSRGIFARRFDAAGVAQGAEFRVNTDRAYVQHNPAIAMDAGGDFVVAWESSGQDDGFDISARRFDAAGAAQGAEVQVNAYTTNNQLNPAVAMDGRGGFVVAWESYGQGDGWDIFARRFDAAGVPQGTSTQVNGYTAGSQLDPAVAMDIGGDFVVAWESYGQGDGWNIFARWFDGAGGPQGTEFQVNSYTADRQTNPAVAMDAGGDFVTAWDSYPQDGSYFGVYAQRFQGSGHVAGDFDSDGRADILWRNAGTGNNVLWRMDGFARLDASSVGVLAAPWRVAGIADFNGDYRADVLWRNDDTRGILLWQMDGADVIAAEPIGSVSAAWQVEGLGDFDGDGQADILWRNPGNRNVRIWRMNGFLREDSASIGVVPRTWNVAGVGDFDGDAKADILWRDAETGNTVIWRMDGFTTLAAGSIGAPATVWQVAGTGDFDGDAKADVLWRNTGTGGTIIWRMDGFARLAMGSIGTVNSGWTVVQLRDTNGDDRVDIVWRNAATGGTVIWQMDGFTKTAAQSIGTVNSSWQVE